MESFKIGSNNIVLDMVDYKPENQEDFIKLFSECFKDDPLTIIESVNRAYLKLVMQENKVVAFMLFNLYEDIKSVVVEYVGVSPSMRGNHIGKCLFNWLYNEYSGYAFFGECHLDTVITHMLYNHGWKCAPINWVCPAWGKIPEDTTRHLMYKDANIELIIKFVKEFYDYGYGVSRPDLILKYKKELGIL